MYITHQLRAMAIVMLASIEEAINESDESSRFIFSNLDLNAGLQVAD